MKKTPRPKPQTAPAGQMGGSPSPAEPQQSSSDAAPQQGGTGATVRFTDWASI
jgi:hypothetical protein